MFDFLGQLVCSIIDQEMLGSLPITLLEKYVECCSKLPLSTKISWAWIPNPSYITHSLQTLNKLVNKQRNIMSVILVDSSKSNSLSKTVLDWELMIFQEYQLEEPPPSVLFGWFKTNIQTIHPFISLALDNLLKCWRLLRKQISPKT